MTNSASPNWTRLVVDPDERQRQIIDAELATTVIEHMDLAAVAWHRHTLPDLPSTERQYWRGCRATG